MSENSTNPRITAMTIVYTDGTVFARCYSGKNFTDAKITPGCLALMVSDGAKLLAQLLSEQTSAELTKAAAEG